MKQEEVKVGLWLRNRSDHANHARVIYVSEKPSALTYIWNRSDKPYSCRFDEMYQYFDAISTPAELKAAGVKDEDRLIEQQDWRIGVELFALDDIARVSVVEVKVDGERIADATDTVVEAIVRTFSSFNRDVTNDPQCLKFYSVFLRDVVIVHRSRRAGGEGPGKGGVKE